MGGDRVDPFIDSTYTDEESSSIEQEFLDQSPGLPSSLRLDDLSTNAEDPLVNEENGLVFGEFDEMGDQTSACSVDVEANQRQIQRVYREVLRSYDELQCRTEGLQEAKSKILSYTPGTWIEKAGGMKLGDYDVPKTTSLLLIGPEGSGKSSLINKISKVFEDDKFASERAQVSYNSSVGDGTNFLQGYMIPRGSTSFCLNDTRGLSGDSSENVEMFKHWMTKGVRHGELVIRESDSSSLKTRMKCKSRQNGSCFGEIRMVNFAIFVVNGLSVLKSMESNDEAGTWYTKMIAAAFNCPFLSFKDDKPVIVVTHGDLLSLSSRTRVRLHLGELLGISPKNQIFDIPESCDPATQLTIVDMLRYCLERADRNLPVKGRFMGKVNGASIPAFWFLFMTIGIAIISAYICGVYVDHARTIPLPEHRFSADIYVDHTCKDSLPNPPLPKSNIQESGIYVDQTLLPDLDIQAGDVYVEHTQKQYPLPETNIHHPRPFPEQPLPEYVDHTHNKHPLPEHLLPESDIQVGGVGRIYVDNTDEKHHLSKSPVAESNIQVGGLYVDHARKQRPLSESDSRVDGICVSQARKHRIRKSHESEIQVDWKKISRLWLGEEYD